MKTKIISVVTLLLVFMTQGAWSMTNMKESTPLLAAANPNVLTPNSDKTEWSLTSMPTYDVEFLAEYYTDLRDDVAINYNSLAATADIWLARTLKAGSYNTFASPFDIDAAGITALGITDIKQLVSSEFIGNTLVMNFESTNAIVAGKPYLVKVASDKVVGGFDQVSVSGAAIPASTTYATFIPTLNVTEVTEGSDEVFFLGANNTLYQPKSLPNNMKGFRAYFRISETANARSVMIDFGDGEATGIITHLATGKASADTWYSLDGRRLNGKPTTKGIFVVNGQKVMVP